MQESSSFHVHLQAALTQRSSQNLARQLRYHDTENSQIISFADNDYLGLRSDSRVIAAAADAMESYGWGGGSSRLVQGNHPLYGQLESALAAMKSTDDCLVFPTGLSMNLGLFAALFDKSDLIVADKLCHASLIDGMRLSAAKLVRFAHNDVADCQRKLQQYRADYRHCIIVTESVFSMDGDCADIAALSALAENFDTQLMVDDAHGLGVVTPPKLSVAQQARMLQTGTLSKSLGGVGGYICASQIIIETLINHCRSIIYTTALPPASLVASLAALQICQNEPQRAAKAMGYAQQFCEALKLPAPESLIVPLIVHDDATALHLQNQLAAAGFAVSAIRPPTVPKNSARLRFTFSARHTQDQLDRLIAAVKRVV